jgi:hypothetical protein
MAATNSVTVRVQHHAGAEVREFEYPLDGIESGVDVKAEKQRRADLFGFSHPRTIELIGGKQKITDVLAMALCGTDTRLGGWCEVLKGDKVVAAHPRQRARDHGAEWVGNLGTGKTGG